MSDETVKAELDRKPVVAPPWIADGNGDGVLIRYNGGEVRKVFPSRENSAIAQGRAKAAYIRLVYPPGTPQMAQVVYPDNDPNIVPVDWAATIDSFIPRRQ